MKKIKKICTFILLICVSSMLLLGCGSSGEDSKSSKDGVYSGQVILGCSTWIGYAPLHVAEQKGFFKKEGVDLKIQVIENDADKKAAVVAGKVQMTAGDIASDVMALESGVKLVQVMPLCDSNGADGIVCKKDINKIEDLKGKKVAFNTTGGASVFMFNYILKEHDMTMEDVVVENMTSGDAGSAFVGGSVDAAVTWEPWLTNAKNTDFGKVLISSKETPGIIVDMLGIEKSFYEKYPKTVQAIIDAYIKTLDYIKDNPEECNKIMADSMGMTVEDFEASLETISYYDLDSAKEYMASGKVNEVANFAQELWNEMGLMSKKYDIDSYIDDSYIKNK